MIPILTHSLLTLLMFGLPGFIELNISFLIVGTNLYKKPIQLKIVDSL